jgi:flagellar export protein FliJ
MAGFKFPLEPVLAYKESILELRQMEFAALERELRQARFVRDSLMAEMEQNNADLQALLSRERLDVEAVNRVELYRQSLSARLKQQQAIVVDLEIRVAGKREELLKAQQDVEVLEALKRRQLQRFEQRLEQAEARLIDESAITGFNRRRVAATRPPEREY